MNHLAKFSKDGAEKILNGEKSIESRFSKGKIAPFCIISSKDLVYIKPFGGDVIGQFRVKKAIFFDGLQPEDLKKIKEQYGEDLNVDENYWNKVKDSNFGTLIFIGSSARFITSPIKIPKKDLKSWIVLD